MFLNWPFPILMLPNCFGLPTSYQPSGQWEDKLNIQHKCIHQPPWLWVSEVLCWSAGCQSLAVSLFSWHFIATLFAGSAAWDDSDLLHVQRHNERQVSRTSCCVFRRVSLLRSHKNRCLISSLSGLVMAAKISGYMHSPGTYCSILLSLTFIFIL